GAGGDLPDELPGSVPVRPHAATRDVRPELPGQLPRVAIALRPLQPQGTLGDGSELRWGLWREHPYRVEFARLDSLQDVVRGRALERRSPGEYLIQDRSQAEDVTPGVDGCEISPRLLRAHVRRRAQRAPIGADH